MKVLVVSDSHGALENIKNLSNAAREENVTKIIHLGDDYDDADLLIDKNISIERVPGVFSSYYTEKDIPNRKIIEIEGWKFLLTHTRNRHENDLTNDLRPEDQIRNGSIDIVLYGHTHVSAIGIEGAIYLINPGHLKSDDKHGFKPSYAILDITKDSIDVIIKELNTQNILLREHIKRQK